MRTYLVVLALLLVPAAALQAGEHRASEEREAPADPPAADTSSSGGSLSPTELERLDAIVKEMHHKNARSMEDNVRIRIRRIQSKTNREAIRSLIARLEAQRIKDGRLVKNWVHAQGHNTPPSGLQVRLAQSSNAPGKAPGTPRIWRDLSAAVGRLAEARQGTDATELSFMTQVGRKAHVQVITKSTEVWDVRPRWRGPEEAMPQVEPQIIENVAGTGLRVHVKAANQHGVILRLTPYFNRRNAGRERGFTRFLVEELATTVRVPPGVPMMIGGLFEKEGRETDSIFSNHAAGGTRSAAIILTTYPQFGVEREP